MGTLSNGWTEILSYFIKRVTNGFVEGMNRAIRAIINRALGYRNFQDFRLKVLAEHGRASSSHYSAKPPFFQMAKVHIGSPVPTGYPRATGHDTHRAYSVVRVGN